MFAKLLVANRGEIACRIMRTAHHLGIRTVAIYSEADRGALHVRVADEAYPVGPAAARESYLDQDRILAVIKASAADALHPGYGFLAENAEFAEGVTRMDCRFIGPSAQAIRAMGSKIEAKTIVEAAGSPVVPGYHGADQSLPTLAREAAETGYPILIKASAGGGGRGMRVVHKAEDFAAALHSAKREALAAFGSDLMLLEKYLATPKHIEVQILADSMGQTRYLFERDCSIQRRHQKVIEEAPAPGITAAFRLKLGQTAVKAAEAIRYEGAGTVEFIVQDDAFYFMEMNTRLQVEHPVTEAICGLDLVEWQLRIAAGESLPWQQQDLRIQGHAVEARIYAENPRKKFLPSTGTLLVARFPDNLRVDQGVAEGDEVSMHYDPMIAKIIAWDRDRNSAIGCLIDGLEHTYIAGLEHNLGFLDKVLQHKNFRSGNYTTKFVEQHLAQLLDPPARLSVVQAALWLTYSEQNSLAWSARDAFRLNLAHCKCLHLSYLKELCEVQMEGITQATPGVGASLITIGRQCYTASEVRIEGQELFALIDHTPVRARVIQRANVLYLMDRGRTDTVTLIEADVSQFDEPAGSPGGRILAPMPGQVIAVHVNSGEEVEAGQALMVVEAMKIEHTIMASHAGKVSAINYLVGDRVEEGVELVTLEQREVH